MPAFRKWRQEDPEFSYPQLLNTEFEASLRYKRPYLIKYGLEKWFGGSVPEDPCWDLVMSRNTLNDTARGVLY